MIQECEIKGCYQMILNQTQNNKTDAYILLQEVLRGWPSLWSFDPEQRSQNQTSSLRINFSKTFKKNYLQSFQVGLELLLGLITKNWKFELIDIDDENMA